MKRLTIAATVAIAIGLYVFAGFLIVPKSWKNDFLNFYSGAEFSRAHRLPELYNPEAIAAFQEPIAPDNPYVVPFSRPHFYAVALTPLSWFSYRTAVTLWICLQTLLLLGCWVWMARRFHGDALVLAAMFFPTAAGVCLGQDSSLILALAVVSYALWERGKELPAGAAAGLMLVKFHLVLLLPVVMLMQKRYRLLAGFCAAGMVLLLIELAVAGPSGIASYWHYLTRTDLVGLSPGESMMVNVKSLLLNWGLDTPAARMALSGLALLLVAAGSIGTSWWAGLTAAGLGGAFLFPHVYIYDLAWTLLPLQCAAWLSKERYLRWAVVPLLTPAPYLMNMGEAPWSGTTSLCILIALATNAFVARRTVRTGDSMAHGHVSFS